MKDDLADDIRKYTQEPAETKGMRPMTRVEKLDELFKYHNPREDQLPKYQAVRSAAKYLAEVIVTNTPLGSDQATAIRKLREAVMTANAAIALDGLNF